MKKFNQIRRAIFNVIEPLKHKNYLGFAYDIFMLVVIFLSILPLMFAEETTFLFVLDKICVVIFIIDYILRWATADFKLRDHSIKAFLKYPITPMAIVDLLSILPSISVVSNVFKLFRLVRGARILRLIRVVKFTRYSNNLKLIKSILKKSLRPLCTIAVLGLIYIAVAGLIAFNVEPELFDNYFDAMFWVVFLWDRTPTTIICRIIAMCSVIFGLSVVALPAGVLSAEYVSRIKNIRREADLKEEIVKVEQDIKQDVEKKVEKDLEKNLEKDLEKDLAKDLKKDLKKDLGKNLEKDLEKDLKDDLEGDLRIDLKRPPREPAKKPLNQKPLNKQRGSKPRNDFSQIKRNSSKKS